MTKPTMSDQQLLAYSSEHLLHELSMLWELAEILPRRRASTETSALVESYGIHLRNLIDFFYREGKDDDVTAWDFMDATTSWTPNKPPPSLAKARKRANKELSHLTQARKSGSPPEKEWDSRSLLKQIAAIAKDFADKASHKKLHHKVREFLQLQPEKTQEWIADNVTHANVGASPLVGVAVLPYSGASTQTQLIQKIDLTEPALFPKTSSSNTSIAPAGPVPTRRSK